jgi:uncharacterized membrane protein YidH (DUF202 family)
VERALRLARPLPSPTLASVLALGLTVVGAVVILTILVG